MHLVDYLIFLVYMAVILGIGFYFFRKNSTRADYYVGNRSISAGHIGLSIVATDVGGGFSIGLGGLGFVMGLAGTWLLFTGLVGAWLAAVLVVPKIKKLDEQIGMLTFPDFLRYKYGERIALPAAIISAVGYLGFTGGQVLAGAKLAAGTILTHPPFGLEPLRFSLFVMTGIIMLYTVLGGIKAVIYTDTVQWIILLSGLFFLGLPFAYLKIGGWDALRQLPREFFSLTNIAPSQFVNWFVTIVPIWFIAMTLYQRIYASKSIQDAKKAWFMAGLFEYPVIAFIGVTLGMMARIQFPDVEPEMGLPMLIKTSLPIGVTGVVIASYFSAIMSTADSCLIASSGNIVNDILERYSSNTWSRKKLMVLSQLVTLIIGSLTLVIAASFQTVLEIILHAYAFMVAGLFVPTLAALTIQKTDTTAALFAMVSGGMVVLSSVLFQPNLPFSLDASFYGILVSASFYLLIKLIRMRGECDGQS
ncbi:sodium:solute symporter family protein [candidate division KSB1 bacterium]|nr:sodium:solute symporter family protein [candidate division KSB1 bacterium]